MSREQPGKRVSNGSLDNPAPIRDGCANALNVRRACRMAWSICTIQWSRSL
jgi:hypothetical protein